MIIAKNGYSVEIGLLFYVITPSSTIEMLMILSNSTTVANVAELTV